MWEGHQQHRPRTCRPLAHCHSSISPEVGWGGGNRGWGFLREQTADCDPPPSVAEPLLRPLPVTGRRGSAGSALVTQRMLGPSQLAPGRESCWFLSISRFPSTPGRMRPRLMRAFFLLKPSPRSRDSVAKISLFLAFEDKNPPNTCF